MMHNDPITLLRARKNGRRRGTLFDDGQSFEYRKASSSTFSQVRERKPRGKDDNQPGY